MPSRFVVEDGEILDTRNREIISRDQLAQIATPAEQAQMDDEIEASGWSGADQSLDTPEVARATTAPTATPAEPPVQPNPVRPSLDEFMSAARPVNPGVPDRDLRRYWAQHYSEIDPKTLPTLEAFMTKARPVNPGVPDHELRAYWENEYGDLGAAETDPKPSSLLRRAADIPIGLAKGVTDLPKAAVGLADIATGGKAGQVADAILDTMGKASDAIGLPAWARPSQWSSQLRSLYSPETQQALTNVGESAKTAERQAAESGAGTAGQIAASAGGAISGVVSNPSAALPLLTENYGGMKVIALGTAKALAPLAKTLDDAVKAGTMTAAEADATLGKAAVKYAAAGEGILTAGQVSSGISAEDPSADFTHRLTAAVAGGVTASITRGVSRIPGLGDTEASMATRALGHATGATGSLPARVGKGAVSEGIFQELPQSAQEQAFQNIGASQPWQEGVGESAVTGLLAGAGLGAGSAAMNTPRSTPAPEIKTSTPSATTPTVAIPLVLGVGNPDVGIDETIKTAWDLLHEDEQIQARNAFEAQRQAEQQLMQGPERPLTVPRPGYEIPLLPAVQPEPEPVIAPGHAFTPRQTLEPDPREVLRQERHGLIGRVMPNATEDMISTSDSGSSPEPAPDVPLQSAADLAYPPSERDRMPSQQDLLRRQNRPQPRSGYEVPTLPAAQSAPPPAIVPGSAFVARNEAELTPKERIAQERAKLVEMKAKQAPTSTSQAATETPRTIVDRVMPKAIDRAYPSVSALHELAKAKGFDIESSTFKTLTKMSTGKTHLDDLSPTQREKFAAVLAKISGPKAPHIVTSPSEQAVAPVEPIAPSRDAISAPSQSGSVQTSEPVSASPPTEGTTTIAPPTETAITTDAAAGRLDVNSAQPIDTAAHEAAPSPTNDHPEPSAAQIEAGNYRKGHLRIAGLDISVENPEGSTRSGTDPNGKAWSVTMQSHYGYIRGTKGKDKEHIDVFVKPGTPEDYNGPVFVIDQENANGSFDEHKVVIGASSMDEAVQLYEANYSDDVDRIRSVKTFTMSEFTLWLKAGNHTKPAGTIADYKRDRKPKPSSFITPGSATLPPMATDRGPGSSSNAQTPPGPGRINTRSKEFKQWFKDSVVTDRVGNPLVVYHGSHSGLRGGAWTETQSTKIGIATFTSVRDIAEKYSRGMRPVGENNEFVFSDEGEFKGEVLQAYLNIKNPITEETTLEEVLGSGDEAEETRDLGLYTSSLTASLDGLGDIEYIASSAERSKTFREYLAKQGYDGFIFPDQESGGITYIPFGAEQIKQLPNPSSPQRGGPVSRAASTPEPFALQSDTGKPKKTTALNAEQTSIPVPPPTIGEKPIIGREVTPEEAPLFSEAAKQPDAEQTEIPQSPTEILASALRTAADQIEGKKAEPKSDDGLTDSLSAFDNRPPYEQRPNEPAARNRTLAREALAAFDRIDSVHDSGGALGRPRRSRSDRPEAERLAGLERAGIRTPAVGISKDLATKGRVDLRGYTVNSMADLAMIAQVFRNPRVETLRFFYVKDGKVVGHEGISSRLPGSSMAFPISSGDLESMTVGERRERQQKAVDDMADRMLRLGADGYYILHNHPSGVSRPSRADVQLTRRFHEELPGLLGHVVIDSNEYSTIDREGSVATERLPEKRDAILEPYRPHPQLGTIIRNPESLAELGKAMQTPEGYVTIVYFSGSDGKTRAIQEIPEALFVNTKEATNFLRGQARAFGAVSTAAYGQAKDEVVKAARELQKNGSLLDMAAVAPNGQVHALTKYGHYMEEGENFGKPEKLIGGTRVAEPKTTYADTTTPQALTVEALNDTPSEQPKKTPSRHKFVSQLTSAQQAALERIHGTPKTWRDKLDAFKSTWKRDLVQGLFDQYAPILDYSKKGYMLSRMAKGGDGTLEALMLYGKPYVDEDGAYRVQYSEKDGLQGFSKVLSALQGEHDRFFEWVAAKRADRLQSIGLENLYSEQDIATLKTLNHGKMPDGTSREVAYLRALKELNDWNDTMVKIGVDSGLISPETRETFKDVPYVPFYRLQEEGVTTGFGATPGLVNQYAWKKLKGGTAHLNDDLLANLLQNWSHIITASAKNRAAKETLRAAELAGVAEQVPSGTPGKGLVEYLEGGKAQVFNVSDPALLDAIAALHYAGLGSIGKPFQAMKRYLSFAVTVNPAYKIRNLIRDSIHSIGTSELSYNPLKNIAEGSKATTMTSETRAQLLAGGGMIRFGSMLDGNNADRTRRLIEKGVDPQYILSNDGAITKFWKQRIQPAFEAYQEFGDRGEQVNRAALYKQLLAKGMTHQEASFWARDLMDFSMAGKWGAVRILTQVVPFMNARLQGLYKLGRATKADYQKMGTTLAAVGLASIGLLLAYGDDDDWKKREDWDRENFWWFKVGGIAVRIPKPFEIGVIGTIAERSVEYLTDQEMTGKRFGERMAATVFNQLSMNPTPQLVKPLMDLYANKDAFTGRPIETMGMERLRKVDRYTDRTSEAARFLGGLGLPDPAQLAMGRWDTLSPVQIDSLIKGYFSWLGTTATTALDYGIRPFVDRGERPNMQLRNVFLAGNFVETLPTGSSRYVSQLYSQAAEIEQAYASYRDALKRGDTEKASEILRDDREKLSQYKMIEKVKREESALSERMKLVQASARLSGEEKRTQLDALQDRKHRLAQRVAERQMQ